MSQVLNSFVFQMSGQDTKDLDHNSPNCPHQRPVAHFPGIIAESLDGSEQVLGLQAALILLSLSRKLLIRMFLLARSATIRS
jgi:hypothetical protein